MNEKNKCFAILAVAVAAMAAFAAAAVAGDVSACGDDAVYRTGSGDHLDAHLNLATGTLYIDSFDESSVWGSAEDVPWHPQCDAILNVVLAEGITAIPNQAFADCRNLTSVVVPDGVTMIGTKAFGNCASLETVYIPGTVTFFGIGTFTGCNPDITVYDRSGMLVPGSYGLSDTATVIR